MKKVLGNQNVVKSFRRDLSMSCALELMTGAEWVKLSGVISGKSVAKKKNAKSSSCGSSERIKYLNYSAVCNFMISVISEVLNSFVVPTYRLTKSQNQLLTWKVVILGGKSSTVCTQRHFLWYGIGILRLSYDAACLCRLPIKRQPELRNALVWAVTTQSAVDYISISGKCIFGSWCTTPASNKTIKLLIQTP